MKSINIHENTSRHACNAVHFSLHETEEANSLEEKGKKT